MHSAPMYLEIQKLYLLLYSGLKRKNMCANNNCDEMESKIPRVSKKGKTPVTSPRSPLLSSGWLRSFGKAVVVDPKKPSRKFRKGKPRSRSAPTTPRRNKSSMDVRTWFGGSDSHGKNETRVPKGGEGEKRNGKQDSDGETTTTTTTTAAAGHVVPERTTPPLERTLSDQEFDRLFFESIRNETNKVTAHRALRLVRRLRSEPDLCQVKEEWEAFDQAAGHCKKLRKKAEKKQLRL